MDVHKEAQLHKEWLKTALFQIISALSALKVLLRMSFT